MRTFRVNWSLVVDVLILLLLAAMFLREPRQVSAQAGCFCAKYMTGERK
jgi:hypothetical protein